MPDPNEIARYTFLPWLRQGVATAVGATDDFGSGAAGQRERAGIAYDVVVNSQSVRKNVDLIGPGDIIGLDRRAIVRRQPDRRVMDFEPNFMAFVDFYNEGFPWRYTPAGASGEHRLRPWMALIVLADGEYEQHLAPAARLPAIAVEGTLLPLPEELWAWAHVHVNEDLRAAGDPMNRLNEILDTEPDLAGSRLLCPRRLLPDTSYRAFLVPTFETGRLTGLGREIPAGADGLAPAWGSAPVVLPAYYSWRFGTGIRGDFEHLVRLLEARLIDPRVGIRDMDVQQPGFGLPGAGQAILGLEGALRTRSTTSTEWTDPAAFQTRLTELINLADDLEQPAHGSDPTVSLPLYARWHALTRRLAEDSTSAWVDELNLDPRTRAAAGLGTRVVQKYQERYMDDAWAQIGEVLKANRLIHRARLSVFASQAVYRRHIEAVPLGSMISITAPIHRKILGSPTTLHWQMLESRTPLAVVDPAFRKALRPGGRIRTRLEPAAARRSDSILERVNAGDITAAPPKRAGDGQTGVDDKRDELRPDDLLAKIRRLLADPPWLLPLVLIVLLAVVLVLLVSGVAPAAALVGAVAAATFAVSRGSRRQIEIDEAIELLDETELTPQSLDAIPARPGFTLVAAGEATPEVGQGRTDSPHAGRFRQALADVHGLFAIEAPEAPARTGLNLVQMRTRLLAQLQPRTAILQRLAPLIGVEPAAGTGTDAGPALEKIAPIMGAPDFHYPMYKELEKISPELLVPNLELIERNTVSLLVTNQAFIESYMVGLNHEMGRELQWREFPTDKRGTYFRQFWDVSDTEIDATGLSPDEVAERMRDIPPIHTWSPASQLGDHNHRLPPGDDEDRLVLLIRSDLFNRYPTAVVTAAPAVWPEGASSGDDREVVFDEEIFPQFKARVGADLTFFGFDLTAEQARGSGNPADGDPGWFFVISERPGEPRFGLDVATEPATEAIDEWNDLSWGHLGRPEEFSTLHNINLANGLHDVSVTPENNPDDVDWATDAGQMAHILYQIPVLVAVHAHRMLRDL